jgi:2-amino-4-hydroxy-6-hydroxymethyldihydropteridine diphosphokinase
MAHKVYISLGSNLGERQDNCDEAILRLAEHQGIEFIQRSSFYETEPVDYRSQPYFVNCVAELHTTLSPFQLIEAMLEVESDMGRVRDIPKGPRLIDLDLLFFEDIILASPNLVLPHPALHQRSFVLTPLCEIAADFQHPLYRSTIRELLERLTDSASVIKLS